MMPSIELRLKTMIKAVQEVILPAIAPGNDLAREQAQLLIAHLSLISQHWRHAHTYDALALDAIRELAERLVAAAEGGEQTTSASAALARCLKLCMDADTAAAVQRATIAAAIDELVSASGEDGNQRFHETLFKAILDHGALQAWRDRVWFAGSGMDPESATLVSIEQMLARRDDIYCAGAAPTSSTSIK